MAKVLQYANKLVNLICSMWVGEEELWEGGALLNWNVVFLGMDLLHMPN